MFRLLRGTHIPTTFTRTYDQIIRQVARPLADAFDPDFPHDIQPTVCRINGWDGRSTHLNPCRVVTKLEFAGFELELLAVPKPARNGRLQLGYQPFANIDKCQPWPAHQPF